MRDIIDESTKKVVVETIRARLDGRELDYCEFIVRTDDDGSRWIDAVIKFRFSPVPVDARKTTKLRGAVTEALSAANDPSNVILNFHFDDNQPIKGFERAPRAA